MIYQCSGLPRSGSAWISAALNLAPDVLCVHEPLDKNVHTPESSYRHVGQAGSHLLVPKYRDMDADLRIFIDRDANDAYESLVAAVTDIDPGIFEEMIYNPSLEYRDKADIIIDFDKLFTEDAVKHIWESISDTPFQRDKILFMLNMNVQRHSLEYDFDGEFVKEALNFNNQKESKWQS